VKAGRGCRFGYNNLVDPVSFDPHKAAMNKDHSAENSTRLVMVDSLYLGGVFDGVPDFIHHGEP
jgi:hypothetical protein